MRSTTEHGPNPAGSATAWPVILCLAAGVLMRVGYLARFGLVYAIGESPNAALAFARTGTLADPFLPGTGPTAHVTPIPPLIAGFVYRLLGERSVSAEVLLAGWAIALTIGSFYFCYRVFLLTGLSRRVALAALVFLCLAPLNINLEVIWFRVWDGGLAVATGFLTLWMMAAAWRKGTVTGKQLIVISLMAALTLSISPPLGVALYLVGGLVLLQLLPSRRWVPSTLLIALVTVLVLAPWAIRNREVLGEPVIFRDNFGLELANAFYPGAVSTSEERETYKERHATIHPYANPAAVRQLKLAGGELAYSRKLEDETKAWISSHPADSLSILIRHFRDLVFPPVWYWSQFSDAGRGTIFKVACFWAITALAIIELLCGLLQRRPFYAYLAVMVFVPLLPYTLVQPTLRYRYIIFAPLVFLAAALAQRVSDLAYGRAARPGQRWPIRA